MDTEDLNQESKHAWDTNAEFWDRHMADGNAFQLDLVAPSSEKLLRLQPGEQVLEIACGNGVFTRRMASLGARVVATDFSLNMLERAKQRKTDYDENIEYRVVDATKEDQLLALGEGRFDAAVCNMAIMDMADIEPMARALPRLLKPGGRFVFSITHPCFNHTGITRVMEQTDRDGEIVDLYSIKVWRYLTPHNARGLAMIGQPIPQPYFERTLSVLFNTFFSQGWALDGIEEPWFDPSRANSNSNPRSWLSFKEIPPCLIVRLRPR
jgi:ubiquinone/menaquinone biosynthesis C-methylase UbiE